MAGVLSVDAADLKHASTVDKQYAIESFRPVQYGKFCDANSEQLLMRNNESCNMMATLRIIHGNDHLPRLLSDFCPIAEEFFIIKQNKLIVQHMMLMAPPEELDADFNVKKTHRVGTFRTPGRVDERWYCWSNVEIELDFIISGDMAMLMQLTMREYSNEKPSSPYHTVLHKETGKILKLFPLPPGSSLRKQWQQRWPNCSAMLDIISTGNDHSEDVQDLLLPPEMIDVEEEEEAPAPAPAAAQLAGAFRPNAGSKTAGRKRKVQRAQKKITVIKDERLRGLCPDFLDARTQVNTGGDGGRDAALDDESDEWRLVFLPCVPEFDGGDLQTALPDTPDLHLLLGICNFHCDIRGTEMIAEESEAEIREALAGSASHQSIVNEFFNDVMKDELKLRHNMTRDEKGNVPFRGFNGRTARLLRNDINKKRTLAQLGEHRRTGAYESKYYKAIFNTLVRINPDSPLLKKLPEIIECAQHFAVSIGCTYIDRPTSTDYDLFDEHGEHQPLCLPSLPITPPPRSEAVRVRVCSAASLFVFKWRLLGYGLRGYGFHMWATLGKLFRKFLYLKWLNQAAVEGNNERFNRQLPRISKTPGGSYKQSDIDQGEARIAEVLAERRRCLKSICRAMYEFAMCETVRTALRIRAADTPAPQRPTPQRPALTPPCVSRPRRSGTRRCISGRTGSSRPTPRTRSRQLTQRWTRRSSRASSGRGRASTCLCTSATRSSTGTSTSYARTARSSSRATRRGRCAPSRAPRWSQRRSTRTTRAGRASSRTTRSRRAR